MGGKKRKDRGKERRGETGEGGRRRRRDMGEKEEGDGGRTRLYFPGQLERRWRRCPDP